MSNVDRDSEDIDPPVRDPQGRPYVQPFWTGGVTTCSKCGNPAADDPRTEPRTCWPCLLDRPASTPSFRERLADNSCLTAVAVWIGCVAAFAVALAVIDSLSAPVLVLAGVAGLCLWWAFGRGRP